MFLIPKNMHESLIFKEGKGIGGGTSWSVISVLQRNDREYCLISYFLQQSHPEKVILSLCFEIFGPYPPETYFLDTTRDFYR